MKIAYILRLRDFEVAKYTKASALENRIDHCQKYYGQARKKISSLLNKTLEESSMVVEERRLRRDGLAENWLRS
jgi:hypothetical protein